MKSLLKCQEMMTIQQETSLIFHIIKIINKLGMDLSRQKIRVFPPKVIFTGNIEEDEAATIFFIANKM